MDRGSKTFSDDHSLRLKARWRIDPDQNATAVERTIGRLEDWRHIYTRYDKLASNFASVIAIAARVWSLKLSFDSRLIDNRPYFLNLFSTKFIKYILGKKDSLAVYMKTKEFSLWRTVEP